MHGKSGTLGFFYVKGPEILNKYVGESEATIRGLFQACREHKAKHGYPALLFIDEADAVMAKRGSGNGGTLVERTIVPMFLSEMDGMDENGAIVVLATNRPDSLDPAITREGRIDRKVKVGRPNQTESRAIAKLYLKGKPLADGATLAQLAAMAAAEVFNAARVMYTVKLKGGDVSSFAFSNLVSGAMMAGVVDQAASLALNRDLRANTKTGITAEDIITSVDLIVRNNLDVDHVDALQDFVEPFKSDVETVSKIRMAA